MPTGKRLEGGVDYQLATPLATATGKAEVITGMNLSLGTVKAGDETCVPGSRYGGPMSNVVLRGSETSMKPLLC
jgi:hypothetical protein